MKNPHCGKARKMTQDADATLFYDDISSTALYGLAHAKDARRKCEKLPSARCAIIAWSPVSEERRVADDLLVE